MSLKGLFHCLIIFSIMLFVGCATIVSDSVYPVNIKTMPNNANFSILDKNGNSIYEGNSSETVKLDSSSGIFQRAEYDISFYKEGYLEKKIHVESSFDNWYLGNILFPGILGLIIDPITGAMWKMPEKISVNLVEKK